MGDDVDMDFDMDDESTDTFSVSLEEGKDDGYIEANGDTYTATNYDGNEFLGWYKKGESTPYSIEATAKLSGSEFVAKFKSNNVTNQNGYELLETGTSLLNDSWLQAKTQDTWVIIAVS